MKYDYLIVGAGLFGAVFANKAKELGKRCLVIDRRSHLGGNIYCEEKYGINVHKYGAHIFHTSDKEVWKFVNSIVEFNNFINSPLAQYRGKLFNLPFNMSTFYQMWGVTKPEEAKAKIEEQKLVDEAKDQEAQEAFANSMIEAINGLKTIESFDLEDEDRERIAEFILGTDATGTNYMYRALKDPESIVKMA